MIFTCGEGIIDTPFGCVAQHLVEARAAARKNGLSGVCHPVNWMRPLEDPDTQGVTEDEREALFS